VPARRSRAATRRLLGRSIASLAAALSQIDQRLSALVSKELGCNFVDALALIERTYLTNHCSRRHLLIQMAKALRRRASQEAEPFFTS
jgi:hypothetical protein